MRKLGESLCSIKESAPRGLHSIYVIPFILAIGGGKSRMMDKYKEWRLFRCRRMRREKKWKQEETLE